MHRIVLVLGQLTMGGLERQASMLARGLDRTRFAVTVVSLQTGGQLVDPLRRQGVPVVQISRRGPRDWRRLFRLAALLRRIRPDLVYSFNYAANAYTRLAGLLARVPIIVTGERAVYMTRSQAALERWLVRISDRVICNAEALRRDLVDRVGLPPSKVLVVRNGVEVPDVPAGSCREAARTSLGLPSEGFVVGTIARLHRDKNLPLLIEAARVCLERLDAWFCVIGSGPEEQSLRRLAARPGLRGRMIFAGQQPEARDLLGAFDIFALTSDLEGIPNSAMEAMALGIPCVCTDAGGCGELIEDGVEGYVVRRGDAAAVSDRILRLAGDPALRAQLGAAARRRVAHDFSIERMIRETESILARLLSGRPGSSRRRRSLTRPQSVGP